MPVAPDAQRGPVLLVAGYGGGSAMFTRMRAALTERGVASTIIDIGDGTGDLRVYAERIRSRAVALVRAGAPSVDVIGFSAGGVTARLAADHPDGAQLIRRIATVGSPHAGTDLATLGQLLEQCPPACRQLAPGSQLLVELPEPVPADRVLTVWTRKDEVVRPATSSQLDGATEVVYDDTCRTAVSHVGLMSAPFTVDTVDAFLADEGLPTTCA